MRKIFFIISILFLFFSCEDVIDLDLKEGKKELVINANIDWHEGTSGAVQTIILSETSGYFDKKYPMVSGASVVVKDESNSTYAFEEEKEGIYICRNFLPQYGETYRLQIEYDGVVYMSEDKLRSPIKLLEITQTNQGGIRNEDIEVQIRFTTKEDSGEINYFLIEARDNYNKLPFFIVVNGNDFQNQQYFVVGSSEDWVAGDQIRFKIYHISQNYYNYMSRLLAVADKYSGEPLTTPPSRVQGNVINTKNTKQNPLGAFRVSSSIETVVTLK